MQDALTLAERADISCRDAALLLARCPRHEILAALQAAAVHELRDATLRTLKEELNGRYPDR